MYVFHRLHAFINIAIDRCDEFEQRFTEVGGNKGVS